MPLNNILIIITAIVGSGGLNLLLINFMTRKAKIQQATASARKAESEASRSAIDSTSKMWDLLKKSNQEYAKHISDVKEFYKKQNDKLTMVLTEYEDSHKKIIKAYNKLQREYNEVKQNQVLLREDLTNQQLIINELAHNYCDRDEVDCVRRHPPQALFKLNEIESQILMKKTYDKLIHTEDTEEDTNEDIEKDIEEDINLDNDINSEI